MAVMRIEKNQNYTVMANYHLRDKEISLKAKGLMSLMLSLPEEWDYTVSGLAFISKEGIDAIRAAVRELENAGYIIRSRRRNDAGQLTDTEYTIYERPQIPNSEKGNNSKIISPTINHFPIANKPTLENPTLVFPTLGKPILEKPAQIKNKDIIITYQSNPYPSSTNMLSSVGTPSKQPSEKEENTENPMLNEEFLPSSYKSIRANCSQQERLDDSNSHPALGQEARISDIVQKVRDQIDYFDLIENHDRDEIDNIVSIMVEVISTKCDSFTIAGKKYPEEIVRQRYKQLDYTTIGYALECLHKCRSDIKNIKQYLIATLFNAPATCECYYSAAVRHDLGYMRQ